MSISTHRWLLACTALNIAAQAHSAFGQQPAAVEALSASGLAEIVVPSRRREERVQTVPLAITAFTQQDVEKKRINQISDLARNVPSLSSSQSNSDANGYFSGQIRLRGLPGSEVYFADVPLGSVDFNPVDGI